MMRFLRRAVLTLVATSTTAVAAQGCRTATQVTIDVRIANATCDEIRGTALTVGVDPKPTEQRVENGFVTSTTTACDPATRSIGTLVLTPSDPMHAAIVVAAAYGD